MENRENVIAIGQSAAKVRRNIWRFSYPHQVVSDPSLGLHEKRAILAAWASDVHAVESLPTLRHLPGTPFPVTFSSIMDARVDLDRIYGSGDDDSEPPPTPLSARKPKTLERLREAA